MSLYNVLQEAYSDYLDYLADNPRVELPYHKHDATTSEGKVHASALGRCPLAAALSRKTEKTEKRFDWNTLHLMQQGVRDAEPLQEAMLWKYPEHTNVELSVEKDNLRGRLDILYAGNVIEIKRRDSPDRKVPPYLRLSDLYQTMAYGVILEEAAQTLNVLLVTRFDLTLFSLVPDGNGYSVVDQNGRYWASPYNKPSYLNFAVVRGLRDSHLRYMRGETTEDPKPNYLNGDSYECGNFEKDTKPKAFKVPFGDATGQTTKFIPKCSHWCHHGGFKPEYIEIEEVEHGSKTYREVIKDGV